MWQHGAPSTRASTGQQESHSSTLDTTSEKFSAVRTQLHRTRDCVCELLGASKEEEARKALASPPRAPAQQISFPHSFSNEQQNCSQLFDHYKAVVGSIFPVLATVPRF